MKPRVVIIGAGFAGIQAAKNLAKSPVEAVLVDRHNYQTFQPLLHQVATGFIEPEQIAYPIRSYFRGSSNLRFHLGEVKQIYWSERLVETNKGLIDYDYLILATGSMTNYSGLPGAKEFTWNLKTLPAAVALRNQIFRCFEAATRVENRDKFISLKQLQKLGIEVYLETKVQEVNQQGVTLNNGEFVPSYTVIWSAGVQGNTFNAAGEIPITKGERVVVLPTLQLSKFPHVYVAGDL